MTLQADTVKRTTTDGTYRQVASGMAKFYSNPELLTRASRRDKPPFRTGEQVVLETFGRFLSVSEA